MAKIDVTLKRYNGSTVDELFPTTHMGQIYTDSDLDTLLSDYLDNTFINQDQLGAANGVATLDEHQKLVASQLPVYLYGGMEFEGTVDLSSGTVSVDDLMASVAAPESNKLYAIGNYLMVSAEGELQDGVTWSVTVLPPGDEGDYDLTDGIVLEAGDWVVVTAIDFDTNTVVLAIVNNTYRDASSTEKGIVRLTDAADVSELTTGSLDVITESFLKPNVATGNLNDENDNGATLTSVVNKIAGADHNHDGRYYTEAEIDSFFSGSTNISGYNNDNWDTAYDEKINSLAFGTGNGVLTLNQNDGETLTVNLDGRYAETITAAQTGTTDGIDIVQTGDDYTIAHHDTSSVADVANTDGNVLQSATFDTFGHVLTRTSVNLDDRYYTETEIDNWLTGAESLGPNNDYYTPIEYGENPTSTVEGAILIDLD